MDLYLIDNSGIKRKAIELECGSCKNRFLKRKDFVAEINYCSKSCKDKAQIVRNIVVCALCKTEFQSRKSKDKNSKSGIRFCSRKCKDDAQRIGSGFDMIQPDHYGCGGANYRDIAYRVFPRKCMVCSFFDEYPELMQVHHIDSDRSNNDISNLAVLCPTHHWAITIRKAVMGPDRIWHWVG